MEAIVYIILSLNANAKILNFTEKMKTAAAKCKIKLSRGHFCRSPFPRKRITKSFYYWQKSTSKTIINKKP